MSLDIGVRDLVRPGDLWNWPQRINLELLDVFTPTVMTGLGALMASWRSLQCRSFRPLLGWTTILSLAVGLATAVKILYGRPDPHGEISTLGGAYPSGHMVFVVAALGGVGIVARSRSRLGWTTVVLATLLAGTALTVTATHWFSDVVGGVLLSSSILAVAERVTRGWL